MLNLKSNKIIKLDYVLIFFICSLPLVLISGPFLPDLFVVLSGLIFIYLMFKKKISFNFFNKYVFLLLSFYLVSIISSFLSNNIIMSFESSLFYFRFYFLPLVMFYLLLKFESKLISLICIILYISLIIIFISILYEGLLNGFNDPQYSGLFGDEHIAGSFTSRFYPLIVCLTFFIISEDNKYLPYILALVIIMSSLILLLSGERASIVYFFISNLFFLFFLPKFKKIFLIIFSALILILSVNISNIKSIDRIINKTYDQIFTSINGQNPSLVAFSPHHQSHYLTAYKMFKHNPIIGIGPKLFREECDHDKYFSRFKWVPYNLVDNNGPIPREYIRPFGVTGRWISGCSTHPHNSYMQLLAETGVIGFGIFLFFFIMVFSKMIRECKNFYQKIYKKNKHHYILFSSLLSIFISLFPLIPTGSIFNNWVNVVYYFPIGLLIYSLNKTKLR